MASSRADARTIQTIRELAAQPDRVRVTMRAECDLWEAHIRKGDVCDAICRWIDAGKAVERITTDRVPEHMGEPAYVMRPEINGEDFYVKVTIIDVGEWREKLLIISSHRPNR